MIVLKFKDSDKIHLFKNKLLASSFLEANSDKVLEDVPVEKIKEFEDIINRKDIVVYNDMFYRSFSFEPNRRIV
jgi:hypothetical protein